MAVTYSQNGVIVKEAPVIEQVAYTPSQQNSMIIDSNGYIGNKKVANGYTFCVTLDKSSDFSQSGLGQVTILNKLQPIDKLIINGNEYGVIQLDNWLIIDRNLAEPIGTLNTDYILPDTGHEDAGYFYLGNSLYDASTYTYTQLATDFLSTVGDGWQFPGKDFRDYFYSKFNGYNSTYFRKETWNDGLNTFGLNFVGARYSQGPGYDINYSAMIIGCIDENKTYCIQISPNINDNITFPEETNVFQYYNPKRIVKKLS